MKQLSLASTSFPRTERPLALSVLALGGTTIVVQAIFLRSFLSVFYGNELVIGIVLASWLVLTGAGSGLRLGRRNKGAISVDLLVFLQAALALLPLATVLLLSYLKTLLFPPGTMIGMAESLYGSLVLLAPFCLVSGFLFTAYVALLSERFGASSVSHVYGLEAAGSVIGGVLFTLLATRYLSTAQTLVVLGVINMGIGFLLSWRNGRTLLAFVTVAIVLLLTLLPAAIDLDALARRWLFAGQEVAEYKDTPYGSVTVTGKKDQLNFFENGMLLFSTGDAASNEEAVHFAMVQRPKAERVLLISGGISGMTDEILKYPFASADYLEINPWLIEMGERLVGPVRQKNVHLFIEDARRYIRSAGVRYDVVLINVPDPGTAQINRYYTEEFFGELKSALNPGAVVSLSVLPSTEYLGLEGRQLSSIIYNTLTGAFANVLVVPGMKIHFLASDGALRADVASMVDSLGINTAYVNKFYLDDRMTEERSRKLVSSLDRSATVNRDFAPAAYYRQVQYWLSYFAFDPWVPAAACALILGFLLVRMKAVSFCMFVGGAAGSSLEVVLLLAFQIMYGSLYLATGMIITAFMAGLSVGSLVRWVFLRRKPVAAFTVVQGLVGLYALFLPLLLNILKSGNPGDLVVYPLFLFLTACLGVLIGLEFSLASRLIGDASPALAGRLYGTDLLGSAAGALVVSAFLLPLLGITWVCVIVGGLSFCGAGITLSRNAVSERALPADPALVGRASRTHRVPLRVRP
jgi:spermidine synthase